MKWLVESLKLGFTKIAEKPKEDLDIVTAPEKLKEPEMMNRITALTTYIATLFDGL
jgi:hypothetical protein